MASRFQLSKGTLKFIMAGEKAPESIMQILETKKIQKNSSDKIRYRLLLSDGENKTAFAMLSDDMIPASIQRYSVIKLQKYGTTTVSEPNKGDMKILLIVKIELVANGDEVGGTIGTPVLLTDDMIKNIIQSASNLNENKGLDIVDSKNITPISALIPSTKKWIIKARITSKSDIHKLSNSRGVGRLFTMNLMDESGEITCTAFTEFVDKYFDFIQVGKVYFTSKCFVKKANRQYCLLKNDYEMFIKEYSKIEECLDSEDNVPCETFNFIPIDQIENVNDGVLIDVIGVCKMATDVETIVSTSRNCELKKKEVFLVDQSKAAVTLTLWDTNAETFDHSFNPVVAVKGAKVRAFGGGKNISAIVSSQIKINPNIPECHKIKDWFDSEGVMIDVRNISSGNSSDQFQTPWLCLKEVQVQRLGLYKNDDYYQVVGTILRVYSENSVYKSCPVPACHKKVTNLENGMYYRCEKCETDYSNFKYSLSLDMNIGDWSSSQWVSVFASEAEKILGKSSQEIGEMLEIDPKAVWLLFQKVTFQKFIFKCRVRVERINGELKLKTVVVNVDSVNYEQYNNYLVDSIEEFMS